MLYIPSLFDLEEELCDGIWSREQLEQMNDVFTRAVSRAFSSGHESPAAAAATVRIGPLRNGKGAVIEAAIDAAWIWLWEKEGDLAFSEIVAFVNARCPGIAVEHVRAGFEKRFNRDNSWKEARVKERLELEQAAGRRTSAKFG